MRQLHKSDIISRARAVAELTEYCVYFLINGDKIVYIGYSKVVYGRMTVHITDPTKIFDRYYIDRGYKTEKAARVAEAKYIERFQPIHNKVGVGSVANIGDRNEAEVVVACKSWRGKVARGPVFSANAEPTQRRGMFNRQYVKAGDYYYFKIEDQVYRTKESSVVIYGKDIIFNKIFGSW